MDGSFLSQHVSVSWCASSCKHGAEAICSRADRTDQADMLQSLLAGDKELGSGQDMRKVLNGTNRQENAGRGHHMEVCRQGMYTWVLATLHLVSTKLQACSKQQQCITECTSRQTYAPKALCCTTQ